MLRVLLVLVALVCALPSSARAVITPAETIDGPGADILDLGAVAMSEDGTGGLVYRRREGGRAHIFAAQFVEGRWRRPQRIDVGQRFDSSWPAIGAGDGGRLVVTWVQEFGQQTDRLFSASLQPGARRFGEPLVVDLNVGEATDTWPQIAMARGGQAFLVYRTTKDPQENPNLPRGLVEGEYRLARYNGQLWTTFGVPVNRNPASPVAEPTGENRPRLVIDPTGSGVMAWQEPDDDLVDRIWARRVFGDRVGIPLLVSPQRIGDQPLRAPADQFDLDAAGFGQATVAFRQRGRAGSPQTVTRVYTATIPESFAPGAARFAPARLADGFGEGGPGGSIGPVSVASVVGAQVTAFSVNTASVFVNATDTTVDRPSRLDPGGSSVPGDPVVDISPSGALVTAYRQAIGRRGQVQVGERRSDGVADQRTVSATRGGAVSQLELTGSGLGDAIVAWRQGTDPITQIAATVVNAPAEEFAVATPADFIRRTDRYSLRWERPPNGIGGLRYAVLVDDDEVADGLQRERYELDLAKLEDGVVGVQVVARDEAGQETSSAATTIKLDRTAPRVAFERRSGRRLRVVVRDGAREQVSGADHAATSISWGDGRRAEGREGVAAVTHTYRRPGRFRVVVRVRDAAGNSRTVARRVLVR